MSLLSAMIKTYKGYNLSQEEIKKLQYKRLKQLDEYARNNSPYIKELYAEIGDDFSLEELPTTNKIEMMNNLDSWITDNYISMQKIEDFIISEIYKVVFTVSTGIIHATKLLKYFDEYRKIAVFSLKQAKSMGGNGVYFFEKGRKFCKRNVPGGKKKKNRA